MMKITALTTSSGNTAKNQYVITTEGGRFYQSYDTIIACIDNNGRITLDTNWNYSVTTSKYRNIFLGETSKETEKKVESGIYKVANLNR